MAAVILVLGSAMAGSLASETGSSMESSILTQLGVFAVCLIVGWFMLRRSDARDERAADVQEHSHNLLLLAKDEVIAALRAEVAALRKESADLRVRIEQLERTD